MGMLVESSLRESLPESDVLVDGESEAESLPLPDPETLPDTEPLWLPLSEALSE